MCNHQHKIKSTLLFCLRLNTGCRYGVELWILHLYSLHRSLIPTDADGTLRRSFYSRSFRPFQCSFNFTLHFLNAVHSIFRCAYVSHNSLLFFISLLFLYPLISRFLFVPGIYIADYIFWLKGGRHCLGQMNDGNGGRKFRTNNDIDGGRPSVHLQFR